MTTSPNSPEPTPSSEDEGLNPDELVSNAARVAADWIGSASPEDRSRLVNTVDAALSKVEVRAIDVAKTKADWRLRREHVIHLTSLEHRFGHKAVTAALGKNKKDKDS